MRKVIQVFEKTPPEDLDYKVNWDRELNGATVASSTWEVSNDLGITARSQTDNQTAIVLNGGQAGQSYMVRNVVEDSNGLTLSISFRVNVVEHLSR